MTDFIHQNNKWKMVLTCINKVNTVEDMTSIWHLFFYCWGYDLPYDIYFLSVEDMTYHITFICLLLRIWPTIWHLFFTVEDMTYHMTFIFLLLRIWPTIWHLFFTVEDMTYHMTFIFLLLRIWPTIWHLFFYCWGYDMYFFTVEDITYHMTFFCCLLSIGKCVGP
jgi:hypothetical protein